MQRQMSCVLLFLLTLPSIAVGSAGDRSNIYRNCVDSCYYVYCVEDGALYGQDPSGGVGGRNWFTDALRLTPWPCEKDCKYFCMEPTVKAFKRNGYTIPQFHGKWPFTRFYGLQEPASVFFSILNLMAFSIGLIKYIRQVDSSAPLYSLWIVYGLTAMCAWTFSTIFHAQDTDLTEKLDYFGAFAFLMVSLFALFARVLGKFNRRTLVIIAFIQLFFFLNHVRYMFYVKFDYSYNLKISIAVGICNGLGWMVWSIKRMQSRPYVIKCITVMLLLNGLVLLEMWDFPPIFNVLDAHSLWHAGTSPLGWIWFSFVIDDTMHRFHIPHYKVK